MDVSIATCTNGTHNIHTYGHSVIHILPICRSHWYGNEYLVNVSKPQGGVGLADMAAVGPMFVDLTDFLKCTNLTIYQINLGKY